MAKIYYDGDADLGAIKTKKIGVIGYGSQGNAHANNLRDSGCQVLVAEAVGSPGWENANRDGFSVATTDKVAEEADMMIMLVPDNLHPLVYREYVEKAMRPGKTLMFAHGFNIHYGQIAPPFNIDVSMIAPKGPGHMVRRLYTEGLGTPALVAVHQDASGKALQNALAYAKGMGSTRAGVLETTFAEETETDLFGEQAVLCGGVTAMIKNAFDTLVDAGYQPEIAYFEVCHELKLIVDLIYQGGFAYMRNVVSDTAEYGDYTRGPRVIDSLVREEMELILDEIRDGSFALEWILENQAGRPRYNTLKRVEANHLIEQVGGELRAMMPWLKK